jgi:RNA-directed DNA polymerase
LARRIADQQVMALIDRILASGAGVLESEYTLQYFPNDDMLSPLERARGLPIGNLTSQFWANLYLGELDTFLAQELRTGAFVRYADDVLLFSNDKVWLHAARTQMSAKLADLRLVLHDRKTQIVPTDTGIPFLGFRLFHEYRRIKRPSIIRFKRRMRKLFRSFVAREIPYERVQASLDGWVAHAQHGNTWRLRAKLLRGISVPKQEHR